MDGAGPESSGPAVPGGEAFRPEPRNPALDSVPGSLLSPGRDRKCPAEVGVGMIGSWRLQWVEPPLFHPSPSIGAWAEPPHGVPQGGRE